MLSYKIEVRNFLNMCLNFKSEHIIKGAVVQIEKKQGKLPYMPFIRHIFPENFIEIPQVNQKL